MRNICNELRRHLELWAYPAIYNFFCKVISYVNNLSCFSFRTVSGKMRSHACFFLWVYCVSLCWSPDAVPLVIHSCVCFSRCKFEQNELSNAVRFFYEYISFWKNNNWESCPGAGFCGYTCCVSHYGLTSF